MGSQTNLITKNMFKGLILLFLSFISSPSLFVNRFESLKEFYSKISTSRAIIGLIYLFFGIFKLFGILTTYFFPLEFVSALLMIVLGFLLGFQWIMENWFQSNYELRMRLNDFYARMLPYEGYLGISALVLAIVFFLRWLL